METETMIARLGVTVLLFGLLAACGEEPDPAQSGADQPSVTASDSPTESPPDEGTPTPSESEPAPDPGATIVVGSSDFGPVLFDDTGQAIYLFDVEKTAEPACYQACAEAWPPVLTTGDPVAGKSVKKSLLGTTERADGTTQVTYNGHPLYFYAHEGKNVVECHDIFLNGGYWYAVHPEGEAA